METLPNNSVFPEIQSSHNQDRQVDEIWAVGGLTIRAYMATKAMQGLLANSKLGIEGDDIITMQAVKIADQLITELNKEK